MMKKSFSLLLVLVLLIPGLAAAEAFRMPNETTGYYALVDDSAELLDRAEYDGVLEILAEELCGKEQKEAVLVLSTVYGEKQLKVSEILGIKLVWGDKEKDLAELMKEDF